MKTTTKNSRENFTFSFLFSTFSKKGFTQPHFLRRLFCAKTSQGKYFGLKNGGRRFLKSGAGFTLIDTLIYIGLFSLIVSFVLVILYQIIGSYNQNRNRVEVDSEANFMMQKVVWALSGAETINQPAINTTSTVLSLNKFNFPQNPLVFDIGSRNLRLTRGGGAPALLGNSRVYVDKIIFEHLPQINSRPEAIKITLTVVSSDIKQAVAASTTLENAIYLRK